MSSAVGQRGWSAQSKTHWVTAAVMIYNVLARSTAQYRALLGDASAQVIKLVPRSPQRFSHLFAVHHRATGGRSSIRFLNAV